MCTHNSASVYASKDINGFIFLCPYFKIPILPFKYNNLLNF